MAPLSDINIGATDPTRLVQESVNENSEVPENDILPTPPNETSIQSTSVTNRLQKRHLQKYLRKIKRVVRARTPVKRDGRLTTLEALEETLNILNSVATNQKMNKQEIPACIVEKPLSPAESSWSSESDQNSNIKSEVLDEISNTDPARERQVSVATTMPASCTRLVATVFLELPQGTITEILPNINEDNYQLSNILRRGDCFLDVLQGKGAQTMLLNAFCGHSKRRMYARIKCSKSTLPFELLCEFAPTGKGPTCTARIQILRLESVLNPTINSPTQHRAVFTTRHNASCAVIYLDSTSIPFLGHFPSEITGRSIFSLIHTEDVNQIKQAHFQLHANGGRIVSTPKLRMVSYNGNFVYTDSEWAAFVNPWTQQIEMIVGKHAVRMDSFLPCESSEQLLTAKVSETKLRVLDSELRSLIAQPVRTVVEMEQSNNKTVATVSSYIDKIVESLVNGASDQNDVQQIFQDSKVSPPTADSPRSAVSLSYNQINCLENVNRLLKSQTDAQNRLTRFINESTGAMEEQIPLTKEVLQQHNKKWEEECKYTWKQRLTLKRAANNHDTILEPEAKFSRMDLVTQPQYASLPMNVSAVGNNLLDLTTQNYSVYRQYPQVATVMQPTHLDEQATFTTFWLDYLNAIQLQAQNFSQIVR